MQVASFNEYGPPKDMLSIVEKQKPHPGKGEVLIKVHAATINDYDWSLVRGKPFIYRLMFGFTKPKHPFPGMELSGVVEATGVGSTRFKVGDAVFGDTSDHVFGTLAEYICINEKALCKKPEGISFESATAIPHAATLALQGLRDVGGMKEGQQVLINGGGGGVGTIGLQIAKLHDCSVTGVDTGEKLTRMSTLGFDQVIDYKKVDFTTLGNKYDLILDCKTSNSAWTYVKALKPGGKYVSIGGKLSKLLGVLFWGSLLSVFSTKKLKVVALKTNKDLEYLADLVIQNKISPVIDGPHELIDTPNQIQRFGEGLHTGKIVIKLV